MNAAISQLKDFLIARSIDESQAQWMASAAGVVVVLVLAWAANYIAKNIILRAVKVVVKRSKFLWDDTLLETGVFIRLSHLAPAMVINTFSAGVLGNTPRVLAGVSGAVSIYLICIWLGVLLAVLNAVQMISEKKVGQKGVPVKGFIQAIKLVSVVVGLIFVLAILLDKSPIYLFSGLGALTAVLMFVFKDAILGFMAGIQISANNMVRVGDWIEMPNAGADGDVIDVSLTTVKVQNWDKTISTIPTYNLISDSFRNWRGMSDSGGRRMKRSLNFDVSSICFANEAQLERWSHIGHVKEHLGRKRKEIAEDNEKLGADANVLGNGRRLTNIGTFRAYCLQYLKSHPHIAQDKTLLVRQLRPTEHGLPLEIYTFVNNTAWAFYEGVQSDIIDHLLAVAKVFDLRVFQSPSGADVLAGMAVLRTTQNEADTVNN
ncbi:MAG: mechanosensitive ion channel [Candidatus Synoicihabitans palmerolidicus]|nr:mechanosensitive ion channel [Candidatus Synoicihabitans palmerolidicus]